MRNCAQRLSASLENSHESQTNPHRRRHGAQRLSASLENSPVSAPILILSSSACSTPFGITGKLTMSGRAPCPNCASAQRLSASLENSLSVADHLKREDFCAQRLSASLENSQYQFVRHRLAHAQCSTPFGITGKLTSNLIRYFAQRCRAQRLSASLENSHAVARLHSFQRGSAQRLSASLENSLIEIRVDLLQRACSTPFGITGKLTFKLRHESLREQ